MIESNSKRLFFLFRSVHQHGRNNVRWKPRRQDLTTFTSIFFRASWIFEAEDGWGDKEIVPMGASDETD